MPGDETLQQNHDESESEEEDDVVEAIPKIDIDPSTLTPLSPEVISKQVRVSVANHRPKISDFRTGRPRSTWVYITHCTEPYRSDYFYAGTIGHVAHGKSTVVKAISGVMTVRFKNELVRNITIKLGYANAKVCIKYTLRSPQTDHYAARSTNVKTKHARG